jgi:hypothetical protein
LSEQPATDDLPREDPTLYLATATLRNCFLNWLVPGLGYYFLGRRRSWVLISACLYGGFLLAVIFGGDLYPFSGEGKLRMAGAFCQAGMGAPYLLAKLLMSRGMPLEATYDYATGYFLLTGMINWLVVMDTFDISVKRK